VSLDILILLTAAFIASIVSGLGGFGGGFIVIIFLSPVVGPKGVIPLIAVFAVCGNLSRIIVYRKSINWPVVVQFTLSSLPGVAIGANIYHLINEAALGALLGVALVLAIPTRRYLKKRNFQFGLRTIVIFGFVFGIVSGTAAGSGMFIVAALSSMGLSGPLLLGTDAAIGFVNAIARTSAYWSLDALTPDLVLAGLLMGIVTLPGTWIASRLVHQMGTQLHDRYIELLVTAGGIFLLYQSYTATQTG